MRKFFVYAFSFIFSLIGNEVYAKSINQDAGFSIGDIELVSAKLNIPEITQDGKLLDSELRSIRTFLEEKNYRVDTVTSVGTFSLLLNQYERNIGKIVPDIYSFSQIQLLLFDLGVIVESDVWNNTTQQKVADYLKRGGAIYNSGELNAENISTLLNDYFAKFGTSKSISDHLKIKHTKKIQKLLKDLGYEPGPLDGIYGKKTKDALSEALYLHGDAQLFRSGYFGMIENYLVQQHQRKTEQTVSIKHKLEARKTINTFAPWFHWAAKRGSLNIKDYGLSWSWDCFRKSSDGLKLLQVEWQAYDPNWVTKNLITGKDQPWGYEDIRTNVSYRFENGHAPYEEYGDRRFYVNLVSNELSNSLMADWEANSWKPGCQKIHGVMFDYWHDYHPEYFSKGTISKVRAEIANTFQQRYGDDFLILGNVNWNKERATIKYLNGVYLELWKNEPDRLYNNLELIKLESLLEYYEVNLRYPKIIALDGWRKTKELTLDDMNSKENRQMAKLLTAMSVVLPTNGYILYADNNQDDSLTDHYHDHYDFYDFDIGQPIGSYRRITNGAALKPHERGIVAYNITDREITFKFNAENFTMQAKSGLFCERLLQNYICLSID